MVIVLDNRPYPAFPWRLNSILIYDPRHSEAVKQVFMEFFDLNADSVADPILVWNKACIRGVLI